MEARICLGAARAGRKPEYFSASLDLPTHTLELLHKSRDFLEDSLLLGQELRVQWAHLRQNRIELRAILGGELALQ